MSTIAALFQKLVAVITINIFKRRDETATLVLLLFFFFLEHFKVCPKRIVLLIQLFTCHLHA